MSYSQDFYIVKKVWEAPNEGTTFLTINGFRKPKLIWYAEAENGHIFKDTTKKDVLAHISNLNELIKEAEAENNVELLKKLKGE